MTRAPVILVAAVLAAGAVLLGAPAPAVAQEGSQEFPRGDAPAGIDLHQAQRQQRRAPVLDARAGSQPRAPHGQGRVHLLLLGWSPSHAPVARSPPINVTSVDGGVGRSSTPVAGTTASARRATGCARTGMAQPIASASLHRSGATRGSVTPVRPTPAGSPPGAASADASTTGCPSSAAHPWVNSTVPGLSSRRTPPGASRSASSSSRRARPVSPRRRPCRRHGRRRARGR